jgi:hypothetical protein
MRVCFLLQLLCVLILARNLWSLKAWNTRFAFKTQPQLKEASVLEDVHTLCTVRDRSACEILRDLDSNEVRDVLALLVDKGDIQRILEVIPLLTIRSDSNGDLPVVLTLMQAIKSLKKSSRRSVAQGQALADASLGNRMTAVSKFALIIALNITMRLNASGGSVQQGEESKEALEALSVYSISALEKCASSSIYNAITLRAFIESYRRAVVSCGPYDNLLRLRSSLLQRPRDQASYTHALTGLGFLDAIVRDRRVELLTLLVFEDLLLLTDGHGEGATTSSTTTITPQCVLDRTAALVASGNTSHRIYQEAVVMLDLMAATDQSRADAEKYKNEDGWRHPHCSEALAIVRGDGLQQRQVKGGDWLACKRQYGQLLDRALEGIAVADEDNRNNLCIDRNMLRVVGDDRQVLVVGDGDLSFSRSLLSVKDVLCVTATSLETRRELISRYSGGAESLNAIEAHEHGDVCFDVDATDLEATLDGRKNKYQYRAFVFNYPFADAGVGKTKGKGKVVTPFSTRQIAVGRHQDLLRDFLLSIQRLTAGDADDDHDGDGDTPKTPPVKVAITLLAHQALAWDLEQTARDGGFALTEAVPFNEKLYRSLSYKRRRSYSNDSFRQLAPGYSTHVVEGWTFILEREV